MLRKIDAHSFAPRAKRDIEDIAFFFVLDVRFSHRHNLTAWDE